MSKLNNTLNKLGRLCCGLILGLILSACANNKGSEGSPVPPPLLNSACAAGSVSSAQYGCLPQGTCPAGYGMYNNQCVPANSATTQSCQAGYIYNQTYGCLAQAGCPSGYGMYNNQCVPANSTPVNGGATSCQGSCQAGYTQTQMGCLPQGSCMACYGVSNNWCYPASSASSYGNTYFH